MQWVIFVHVHLNKVHMRLETVSELAYWRSRGITPPPPGSITPALSDADMQARGHYVKEQTKKDFIVLHFTAGFLPGDIATLTTKDHLVSTPFVVANSGAIVECHPVQYWSYHLGRGATGGNANMSKRGIGIEISNVGPLILRNDGWLVTTFGRQYCRIEEKQHYIQLDKPYRGFRHFAALTDAQYKTVGALVYSMCKTHDIPMVFLDRPKRFEFISDVAGLELGRVGIFTHANFRRDKFDFGPSLDFVRLYKEIVSNV